VAIHQYLLPAGQSAANALPAIAVADQWDKWKDTQPLHKSCSAASITYDPQNTGRPYNVTSRRHLSYLLGLCPLRRCRQMKAGIGYTIERTLTAVV